MLRTALIALSATAAMGVALSSPAQAKTHVDLNIGIGVPGGYIAVGEPTYGYYNADYGYGSYEDDCHYVKVKHKKWKADGTKKVWFTKELVCY